MGKINLESDQARWAERCSHKGDCPICNGSNEEEDKDDELLPECPNCGHSDMMSKNSSDQWRCDNCGYEDDYDTNTEEGNI